MNPIFIGFSFLIIIIIIIIIIFWFLAIYLFAFCSTCQIIWLIKNVEMRENCTTLSNYFLPYVKRSLSYQTDMSVNCSAIKSVVSYFYLIFFFSKGNRVTYRDVSLILCWQFSINTVSKWNIYRTISLILERHHFLSLLLNTRHSFDIISTFFSIQITFSNDFYMLCITFKR